MEKSVTRRNFLIGGAAVSGITALGLVGCSSTESSSGTPTAETGKRSGYHPDLPGLCAHARCKPRGHRPYRNADVVVVGIRKRRHFCRHQGGRARRPCYFGSRRQLPKGNFHDHRGASPHSMESSNVPRVRLRISTAFIRPLWIGTTGGPKQRLLQNLLRLCEGKAVNWAVSHGASLVWQTPKAPLQPC